MPELAPPDTLFIALDQKPVTTARALGHATEALLRGQPRAIVFNLGAHATDSSLLRPLTRWHRKTEVLLRARKAFLVFVVPRFWHYVQWRLATAWAREGVKVDVTRSMEGARARVARTLSL
jgi:hypothetical protein